MKNVIFMLVLLILIPLNSFSQTIENLDYISPFNEGFAAIKKNSKWAFINNDGDIVVNFRDDLVTTKLLDGDFPVFKNGRCLVEKEKNGVSYFGYIDTSGKTVIEPQFLNATNFKNGLATVLELKKEQIGKNTALDKNVVYYKYFEVTLDTTGAIKNYLTLEGVNIVLDKEFLRKPPRFTSKKIADNLVASKNKKGKWTIMKIIE